MYLLRKYVRQAGAAPLPEPSQPSDPATRWAGDLRGSATLARAVLADGQNPTLPCLMAGDVGRGFEAQQSRKNPHERDHGDRAIGAFSGGMSDAAWLWHGCKKLHFHFLPHTLSLTLYHIKNRNIFRRVLFSPHEEQTHSLHGDLRSSCLKVPSLSGQGAQRRV